MSSLNTDEREAHLLSQLLQADSLPGVFVSALRPWRDIADEALDLLAEAGATKTPLYVRQGELVRIVRKEDGAPSIEALSDPALKDVLAHAMNFVKIGHKGPVHIAPPDDIVRNITARASWPFQPLEAIIEFPVFRPDGTLILQPGYDTTTRLSYAPNPKLVIPPVANEPTDEEIVDAIALIDEAIGEFPYQDTASHANAYGLLLTPIIRQSISGHVPLALLDATRPGTGKTLLAETVAMIATGRKAAMMAAPYNDDNEWRKRIAATLADGATIIVIDNVHGRLQSAALDLALTSHTMQERILGQSKNGVYAQRATWIATGNNIQLGGDMPRRSYWVRMDAQTDKPWMRGGFTHHLEEWVPAHRGELIAALLTLARAWYAAGRPTPTKPLPRMGSFQNWVEVVGGILHFVGLTNFLENLDDLYAQADSDAGQWAAFLHAWQSTYGSREVLVADLIRDLKAAVLESTATGADLYNALPDELTDIHRGDFRRRLGKALASRVGSQFDVSGLHLVKASTDRRSGAVFWQLAGVQVSQVLKFEKLDFYNQLPPSERLGGEGRGDFAEKFLAESDQNKPAKPANLQTEEEEER
jgi:hypothetical protein